MSTATALVHCQRCAKMFDIPQLSELSKLELAEFARSAAIPEVIEELCRRTGTDRRSAKYLALHVTRMKRVCHRCYYPLLHTGQSECPHCGALNLDW